MFKQLNGSNDSIYFYEPEGDFLGWEGYNRITAGVRIDADQNCEFVRMKFVHALKNSFKYERNIYKRFEGNQLFPKFYDFIRQNGTEYLITELKGMNLAELRQLVGEGDAKRFSIKTTMQIGLQIIEILKTLHNKSILYGNVAPKNFVIGRTDKKEELSKIFVCDLGECSYFRHEKIHIQPSTKEPFDWDFKYGSLYAADHEILSRKDELESLGYVMIEFLNGKLPWVPASYNDPDNFKRAVNAKRNIRENAGKICTETMIKFIEYAQNLGFAEDPDYDMLKGLLQKELEINHTPIIDNKFDWTDIELPETKLFVNEWMKLHITKEELKKRKLQDAVIRKLEKLEIEREKEDEYYESRRLKHLKKGILETLKDKFSAKGKQKESSSKSEVKDASSSKSERKEKSSTKPGDKGASSSNSERSSTKTKDKEGRSSRSRSEIKRK